MNQSNNSPNGLFPQTKPGQSHRLKRRYVMALLLLIVLLVAVLSLWIWYAAANKTDLSNPAQDQTARQAAAAEYNENRITIEGQLKRISAEQVVITVDGKEQVYTVTAETEINRGNGYDAVKSTELRPGATIYVTYVVETKQAEGIWQQDEK